MRPMLRLLFVIVSIIWIPGVVAAQGVVSGRIRADEPRVPLAGAEVFISALSLRSVADGNGRYRLVGIPPGLHELEVRLIGYAPARLTLETEAGDSLDLDVVLLPAPFELPTLTAEVARVRSARLAAFDHRRRMGFGRFITEDDLKAREGSSLADILRMRAVNVAVGVDPDNRFRALPVARASPDIRRKTNTCFMHVLVDGVEVPLENIDLNTTAIQHYAAIEIYQRPTAIPIEYTATGFSCGAIFLWTKT